MVKCDHCGKDEALPFSCSYCGGSFCSDHRLPPSHNCINLEKWHKRATASGRAAPGQAAASPPGTPCSYPGCGTRSQRTFYCPACGNDYCGKHRHHSVHAPGSAPPANSPQPAASSVTAPVPENPVSRYGIALILAALIIIAGGLVIASRLSPGGTGTAVSSAATILPAQTPAPATLTTVVAKVSATPVPTTPWIQPTTGTIVAGHNLSGGRGVITIDNTGGGSDVVAVLTSGYSKNTVIAVYIRQGSSWSAGEVADGMYELYVNAGNHWDPGTKRFTGSADYWKFEEPVTFRTTETIIGHTNYRQPTHWTLVIYPSFTGNAVSEPVSETNFPSL